MSGRSGLEIAVVGMAGRFPGADGVAELGENLWRGVESITRFGREELLAAGVEPGLLDHPNFVSAGTVVAGADLFDAGLFGFTAREAELLDPQQRLLLECAWEALERAGHGGETSLPVAVFVGASEPTYLAALGDDVELAAALGRAQLDLAGNRDFLATRLAYKLDLRGPAVTVQTACSTSLVAIHLAAASLLSGDCDLALAGGASLRFPEVAGYLYREGGIGSPDGRCRAFDELAAGTVAGSGVAVVALRRLADALADGDPVHAVLRGSAFNNDGARKVGFTAPSVDGQAEVIRAALDLAEVDPATIGFIEAHGTGTPLGDPIEVAALKQAFGAVGAGSCALGSIKSNLGHLDAAAGVAGFVKAVLAVRDGRIPPSLHVTRPNPKLELAGSPFYLAAEPIEWRGDGEAPRRAGVSSFGIGGTNAHAVVEQPPPRPASGPSRPLQLLVVSARSEAALDAAARGLAGHLRAHPALPLADVAATLARGRRAFERRAVAVAGDGDEAVAAVVAPGLRRRPRSAGSRSVVFLFPGQGAQVPGMGRALYAAEPAFRRELDRCAEAAGPLAEDDGLLALLFPEAGEEAEAVRRLARTAVAQPALFAVEIALAALWREWGITPEAMIGHSVGEYAAACLAGVFGVEEGIALLAERGRLMDALPTGAMLAVPLPVAELAPRLSGTLAVAAINAPQLTAVSGSAPEVERLERELAAAGIATRPLRTSHAFHGPMMEPILPAFRAALGRVRLQPPRLPYVSNLTGGWITPDEATDPDFWVRHLRRPVRFADGVTTLLTEPSRAFLEVGPGRALTALVLQILPAAEGGRSGRTAVASLPPPGGADGDGRDEVRAILTALGELWLDGTEVDWEGFYRHQERLRVELPPYPFERRRYRLGGGPARRPAATPRSDLLYRPLWQQAPAPAAATPPGDGGGTLILADGVGVGERLAARLAAIGERVDLVTMGEGRARSAAGRFALDPADADGYAWLARRHLAAGPPPRRVIHLWSLGGAGDDSDSAFARAQERGFWSLLRLSRALAEAAPAFGREWTVVTSGIAAVSGEEPLTAANALLLGVCSALPSERPGDRARTIDVLPPDGEAAAGTLVDALLAELATAAPAGDPLVALRGRHRWRRRLEAVAGAPATLRPGGVYWITGGLGGVGLALAGALTGAGAGARSVEPPVRLVLTGRTAVPPREEWRRLAAAGDGDSALAERLRRVEELERRGAEILMAAADVTDRGQMASVLARVRRRWGRVDGVIHAAGVPVESGGAGAASDEGRAAVLAPRVAGARVLLDLFIDTDLDFLVLCSSLASLLGGPAAEYCAANAYLDTVAEAHAGRRPRVVALGWDTWREAGSAVAALATEGDPARRRRIERRLAGGLSNEQAGRALLLALATSAPHLAVSARPLAATTPGPGPDLPAAPARPAEVVRAAPAGGTEARLSAIWSDLFGVVAVGLDDDFFALGGHSLLAAQMMTRIQDAFGADLPLAAIFEAPTVRRLAEVVAASGSLAGAPAAAAPPAAAAVALSFSQQRLWFLDRLEPGNAAYHLPGAFRLTGPLDAGALAAAFSGVVARHQALRTRFPADAEGRATATADPPRPFSPARIDLAALPADRRLPEAQRAAAAEAAAPFDLAAAPPLRAAVVRVDGDDHVLLLTVHHIVADLWSMGILLGELAALYGAALAGRPSPLAPLPMQYADYAAWQRERLAGDALEVQVAYWLDLLAGELPVLALPTDRPRPRVLGSRGLRVPVTLEVETSHALAALGRSLGATLFTLVAASYVALLHRYSGQEDFLLGFPIASRRRREAEGLIGLFINTLVLRARPTPATPFAELVAAAQRQLLDSFHHQDLPFERLVELVDLPRDLGRTPLFQAMVGLLNAPHRLPIFAGVALEPLPLPARTAQFDQTLELAELEGVVRGTLEVNAALFDRSTAERMVAHLVALVRGAVARPGAALGELPLLGAAEQRQLLVEWSGEGRGAAGTAPGRIVERAAAAPERIAVVSPAGVELAYGELVRRADALARRLAGHGIGVGDRVGVLADRSVELVVALVAILRAGAAYLPLPVDAPRERLAGLIADARPALVLAGPGVAGKLAAIEVVSWPLGGDGEAAPPAPGALAEPPAGGAAYVLYTSGSTGAPKGVVVPHRALAAYLAAAAEAYPLSAEDRVLQFASLGFDTSVEEIFFTLSAGATLVLRDDAMLVSPADFVAGCERRRITVLDLPTSYWHELAAAVECGEIAPPPGVRLVIVGGERLLPERAAVWVRAMGARGRLVNSYGPTEATVAATFADLAGYSAAGGEASIGRPMASSRVYLLDRRGTLVPVGVAGEVALGGPALARGYLGRPAATAERFVPDPFGGEAGERLYLTGDLARRRPDGRLEFIGRRDHQVKVRGYRVELGEVEAALLTHPEVVQAAVVVREEQPGRRSLAAYAAPRLAPAALRAFLLERLPPHLVPAILVTLDALPRTPSGKVDRRALPEPAGSGPVEPGARYRPPETPLEERLAALWRQVLGVERVGVDDNFFDLGGDSILSIQIVARAAREGLRLAPRQLFEHQTVALLASAVGAGREREALEPAEQGPLAGPVPLTPIQRWLLDGDPPEPHYFNQSLLLAVVPDLAPATLAAALTRLVDHHDALRSRFTRAADGWRCAIAPAGDRVPLVAIDLAGLAPARRRTALAAAAARLQGGLDLERGPLVRAARFDLAEDGCRLLLVVHHLVVDGVSWRILVEDLRAVCAELAAGRPARLPAKTTSFRRWAVRLAERAGTPSPAAELEHWLRPVPPAAVRLPVDRAGGLDLEATTAALVTRVGEPDTAALLRRGGREGGVEEALLAALCEACAPWTGSRTLLVDREGHGRDEDVVGAVDLSRTVGWFTAVHPVVIELPATGDPGESLHAVTEELRRAPRRGLGYGLLRHLAPPGDDVARLRARPAAEVSFNYLGRLDELFAAAGPFAPAAEGVGPQVSPRQPRRYRLEVDAAVRGGRLQVVWRYGARRHRRTTIEGLAERFTAALRRLVVAPPAADLDRVLAELEEAEEVS